MLKYQHATSLEKGNRQKIWRLANQSGAETQEDFTSQKLSHSVFTVSFKKNKCIVCMNVAIVQSMNSCNKHSSYDNSTSALLFSQG